MRKTVNTVNNILKGINKMGKTTDEIIKNANDPEAMKALVNLAFGRPSKKTVTKYVVTVNPDTGRKKRTASEVVVTETENRPDKTSLYKVLELTEDIENIDVELKKAKKQSFEAENDDEQELYDEAERLGL